MPSVFPSAARFYIPEDVKLEARAQEINEPAEGRNGTRLPPSRGGDIGVREERSKEETDGRRDDHAKNLIIHRLKPVAMIDTSNESLLPSVRTSSDPGGADRNTRSPTSGTDPARGGLGGRGR